MKSFMQGVPSMSCLSRSGIPATHRCTAKCLLKHLLFELPGAAFLHNVQFAVPDLDLHSAAQVVRQPKAEDGDSQGTVCQLPLD